MAQDALGRFKIRGGIQIQCADGASVPGLVQLLRVGEFTHPKYGDFEITKDDLRTMYDNFKNNVRRVDLAIDYAHNSDSIAAGWIKDVYLKNGDTELWAKVEWTPQGEQKIQDKEFRYLSADFADDYEDNESLKSFGPTLLGAGLTNRPVIKSMEPTVELQEITRKENQTMALKRIAKKSTKKLADRGGDIPNEADKAAAAKPEAGQEKQAVTTDNSNGKALDEDMDLDQQMLSLLTGISQKLDALLSAESDEESGEDDEHEEEEAEMGEYADDAEEHDEKAAKGKGDDQDEEHEEEESELSEDDQEENAKAPGKSGKPAQEATAKGQVMMGKKKLGKKKLSEGRRHDFDRMLVEGRVVEAQREAYLEGDMKRFAELHGTTKFRNLGAGHSPADSMSSTTSDQVTKLAEGLLKEGKVKSLGEGISRTLSENTKLRSKYEKEVELG